MAEQTGPVEVLTLEQYQQARQRGKAINPGTQVMVPAGLLSEMQAHMARTERSPHGNAQTREKTNIVEMTYVGQYTQSKLVLVKQGKETLSTLRRQRRMMATKLGDLRLSMDETINLLERSQNIQKTVEELNAEVAEYQTAIKNIEREPDAYVLPEIARDWYEQQIERIHQFVK